MIPAPWKSTVWIPVVIVALIVLCFATGTGTTGRPRTLYAHPPCPPELMDRYYVPILERYLDGHPDFGYQHVATDYEQKTLTMVVGGLAPDVIFVYPHNFSLWVSKEVLTPLDDLIAAHADVYFVTYSVVSWVLVFVSEPACRIVTDSLALCHAHKGLRVNAYVIMPTHIHAILFDHAQDSTRLTAVLDALRRYTVRALADYCANNQPPVFIEALREAAGADRLRRFCQPTRHPIAIRSERFWQQRLDYIHGNPVRKGLVRYPEDWRFSEPQSPPAVAGLLTEPLVRTAVAGLLTEPRH